MATYPHDYTAADVQTPDEFGAYVKVQHNLNKDQPHVSIWRKFGAAKFLENNPKVRQVSNNELRIYTAPYGSAFTLEVRVSD